MESRRDRSSGATSPQADARGQMEGLGVILLLGFTVLVGSTIAIAGATVIQGGQDSTQHYHAENELAVLGSKIAEVGLGDTDIQQTSFSSDDGTYEVREDAGTMRIEHYNRSGNDKTEVIHEVSLGAVVYVNGDTEKAYQGGGVWSKTGDYSSMVSPPEFHYRDGTLTLPMMNVTGDSRASGRTDVIVRSGGETRNVYPNPDDNYSKGDQAPFVNPIENGTIRVTVEGDYYQGWKQYFEERTSGEVNIYDNNQTARVDLVTLGDKGETDIREYDPIELRGLPDEDPMEDFNLTIAGDGSSGLNNLNWELTLNGDEFVRIHNQGSPTVEVTDGDGTTWSNSSYETEGKKEDETLQVNLTSSDVTLTDDDGNERPLREVFNERLGEAAPNANLVPKDSNGKQRVNHGESNLFIDYGGDSRHITYLQVTENVVVVEFS